MKMFGVLAGAALAMTPGAAHAVVTVFATFAAVNGTAYNVPYDDARRSLYTTSDASASSVGTPERCASISISSAAIPSCAARARSRRCSR